MHSTLCYCVSYAYARTAVTDPKRDENLDSTRDKRQEKLMKAVMDRSSLSASVEDGVKKAKPLKPTLQRLTPSDDI